MLLHKRVSVLAVSIQRIESVSRRGGRSSSSTIEADSSSPALHCAAKILDSSLTDGMIEISDFRFELGNKG